ncbi:DUF1648 domain-containing protein ['Paenibacillus yunnanensis' Narsing Rao et al. 2020]|uniref:DUF1648 domain-containing protein n=1 Tax=Paenibacillus tengchongensis TaxID=2608684 RepID=UPI00124C70AB|nr:DUF1648 domain-containing protein [Paenibacillus tengchongensis]
MTDRRYVYLSVGLIFLTLVINLIAYSWLPDQIGIHMSGGQIDNYVGKLLFVFLVPGLQAFVTVMTLWSQKPSKNLVLILVNVFCVGLDIWMINYNLNLV